MKGCLLLQRNFAYIGHDIAIHLKEKYGVDQFCAYVYIRTSYDFLRSQKDIAYSTLLLDEDIHQRYTSEPLDREFLERLEKEYGIPSLWNVLAVDRMIMSSQLVREYPYDRPMYSHEDMLRILQVKAKAILEMFDREKPDFLFCSAIGSIGSLLLYRIAKKRGIKTFNILPTCLRNRQLISEDYAFFSDVDRLVKDQGDLLKQMPVWNEAGIFLETFRQKPVSYASNATPTRQSVTRGRQLKFLLPWNLQKNIRSFWKMLIQHWRGNDHHDYDYIGPWNFLKDATRRKLRNLVGLEDLYDAFTPDEDSFAFFPLHYEPEIALLLQAPFYTDQIALIRQIARSLPVQYKLYVKEHPVMAEYRPRSFYKQLKKIPNVKLIQPTISSFPILQKTKLVFTITGTAGWEGLLLKKPLITFGHAFYNSLKQVCVCREIERLPELVFEQLREPKHDEDELRTFLAAIFSDSIEIDLNHLWFDEKNPQKKEEGIRPLADLLAKKLGR